MAATADELKRLAFIRHLFRRGVEQSQQPAPLQAASLLMFHDAVELFLALACEHCQVAVKDRTPFEQYFDLLAGTQPPILLSGQAAMIRLNKARVNLKHYGNWPSSESVESFRGSATSFFDDNTTSVFGAEFDKLSLVSLVADAQPNAELQQAESLLAVGDINGALQRAALAFNILVRNFEQKYCDTFCDSPFEVYGRHRLLRRRDTGADEIDSALGDLADAIEEIGDAQKVVAFGFDIRRHQRFRWWTPAVWRMGDGSYQFGGSREGASVEEVRFSIDFVVECAFALQSHQWITPHPRG